MRWPPEAARCLLLACFAVAACASRPGQAGAAVQTAPEINVAGIVIDHGEGRQTYAIVPFAEDSLSGVELLERSGLPLLTVGFGGLGSAVCTIEDTGCDLSACRARLCQTGDPDSPFWQYAQLPNGGVWSVAPLGAGSSMVEDGDVDGWFWSGNVPNPDLVSLEVIADRVNVDLDSLRSQESGILESPFVTIGASGDNGTVLPRWELIGGFLILGGVIALGVLAFVRSRKPARR